MSLLPTKIKNRNCPMKVCGGSALSDDSRNTVSLFNFMMWKEKELKEYISVERIWWWYRGSGKVKTVSFEIVSIKKLKTFKSLCVYIEAEACVSKLQQMQN